MSDTPRSLRENIFLTGFQKHDVLNPFFTEQRLVVSNSFGLKKQPPAVFYKKQCS